MVVGGYNDLSKIGRVGKNFLVPGHSCVKTDFTCGSPDFSDGVSFENSSVFENKKSGLGIDYIQNLKSFANIIFPRFNPFSVEKKGLYLLIFNLVSAF